jgi:surface antigen
MNMEREKLLAAYVDGELSNKDREWVESLLTRDKEAALFVDALVKSNKLLRDTYNPILDQPVPEKLLPRHSKKWGRLPGSPLSLMAAASVATAIFVGGFLASEANTRQELDAIHQKLAELRQHTLEYSPSGTPVSWNDTNGQLNFTIEPLKTYRTPDNHYCREYREIVEDMNGGTEVRIGLACRSGKTQWDERGSSKNSNPDTETNKNQEKPKVIL